MNNNEDLSKAFDELKKQDRYYQGLTGADLMNKPLRVILPIKDFQVMFFLSILALTVSCYLAFGNTSDGTCDFSSKISCSSVLQSSYGKILDVPVAWFGLTWNISFLFMLYKLHQNYKIPQLVTLIYIWNSISIGFVLYFVIAEYIIGSICPFCTIVHAINIALMVYAFRMYNTLPCPPTMSSVLDSLKVIIGSIILAHIIFVILYRSQATQPEPNSYFAKCLRDQNMVFYGSYRCHVCVKQKKLFQIEGVPEEETPWKHINFVECSESDECSKREIFRYPTWIRYETPSHDTILERHEGIMTRYELSKMSGCSYDSAL